MRKTTSAKALVIMLLLAALAPLCFAQAPDIDSLASEWDTVTVNAATYVNPSDSTNYVNIWYNIRGEGAVWRYYEGGLLTWANTLTEGVFPVDVDLRTALAAWQDPVFRLRFQAITSEYAVTDR